MNRRGRGGTFPAKAGTDGEGTLSLAIPTGLPDAEVDVVVVVEPTGQRPADRWPERYSEQHFGSLREAGLNIAYQLILVTLKTREFARVPGLRFEDWELT
jgi:hypothetical protein